MSIEAMKKALEALENAWTPVKTRQHQIEVSAIAELSEAIAAAEKAAPVWVQPDHLEKARLAPFLCRVEPQQRDDFVSCYPLPPDTAAMLAEKDALLRQALEALEAYSKSRYVRHEHPKKYAAGNAVAEAIRNHLGVEA